MVEAHTAKAVKSYRLAIHKRSKGKIDKIIHHLKQLDACTQAPTTSVLYGGSPMMVWQWKQFPKEKSHGPLTYDLISW